MREMQHDDRQDWTTAHANATASKPAQERSLRSRVGSSAAGAQPSEISALTSTRSDWLLHAQPRAEAPTPVVSPSEGAQTALMRSSEFREEEAPESCPDGACDDLAAEDDEAEEFLTIGELAEELRYVERAPRTPRAKVIAGSLSE